jgi:hypothetical protein
MPVLSDEALVSRRLQLSKHALVLCFGCLFSTLFGVVAITLFFRLVAENHAGSPAYWSMIAMLLLVWLASLINMYRHAIRQARAVGNHGVGMIPSKIRVEVRTGRASGRPLR